MPRVGALVHGVQVQGGLQLGLAARQEHDAGDRGGHAAAQHAQRVGRHLRGRRGEGNTSWKQNWGSLPPLAPGQCRHTSAALAPAISPARTSSGVGRLACSAPGVTMEGLSRMPSNSTLLSAMYLKVSAQVASATSRVRSMSWSPSSRISGSTMGTCDRGGADRGARERGMFRRPGGGCLGAMSWR